MASTIRINAYKEEQIKGVAKNSENPGIFSRGNVIKEGKRCYSIGSNGKFMRTMPDQTTTKKCVNTFTLTFKQH